MSDARTNLSDREATEDGRLFSSRHRPAMIKALDIELDGDGDLLDQMARAADRSFGGFLGGFDAIPGAVRGTLMTMSRTTKLEYLDLAGLPTALVLMLEASAANSGVVDHAARVLNRGRLIAADTDLRSATVRSLQQTIVEFLGMADFRVRTDADRRIQNAIVAAGVGLKDDPQTVDVLGAVVAECESAVSATASPAWLDRGRPAFHLATLGAKTCAGTVFPEEPVDLSFIDDAAKALATIIDSAAAAARVRDILRESVMRSTPSMTAVIGHDHAWLGPEVERLALRSAEAGVVRMHANWGPDAESMSAEERAAAVNATLDQAEFQARDRVSISVHDLAMIYRALSEIVEMTRVDITREDPAGTSPEVLALRRRIGNLAEFPAMHAGQALPTAVYDAIRREIRTKAVTPDGAPGVSTDVPPSP